MKNRLNDSMLEQIVGGLEMTNGGGTHDLPVTDNTYKALNAVLGNNPNAQFTSATTASIITPSGQVPISLSL